jgi:DNA repair exonuclease SbcCD ATPase subunit
MTTVEVLSGIVGALVTLITAGSIAYSKIRQIKNEHEAKLIELQTAKEVALADANAKLKESEDKRQNEAFDRLSAAFDTQVRQYKDLLARTQKLEEEHSKCEQNVKELRQEIAVLKVKG